MVTYALTVSGGLLIGIAYGFAREAWDCTMDGDLLSSIVIWLFVAACAIAAALNIIAATP